MADFKPLYRDSFAEAVRQGEQARWRESQKENIRCRDFMDNLVRENYDGSHIGGEIPEKTVAEFGYDRTMRVLASHIQHYDYDGRFNSQNKAWAQGFFIPRPAKHDRDARDHNNDFLLNSHACLVDYLVTRMRDMYAGLNLYDHRHRVPDSESADFTCKVLILRDTVLKDECRVPENQLFLAEHGFGCDPDASGRKVFGRFLVDGEETNFNRADFVGVCDENYLPDWAKQKIAELQAADASDESESQSMPGMKGM